MNCNNPNCREKYDAAIEDGSTGVKCPICSQVNLAVIASPPLTGRCNGCEHPLDDHMYARDGKFACRYPKEKK